MSWREKSPATDQSNTGDDVSNIVSNVLDRASAKLVRNAVSGDPLEWITTVEKVSKLRSQLLAMAQACDTFITESDEVVDESETIEGRIAAAVRLRRTTMTFVSRKGWLK